MLYNQGDRSGENIVIKWNIYYFLIKNFDLFNHAKYVINFSLTKYWWIHLFVTVFPWSVTMILKMTRVNILYTHFCKHRTNIISVHNLGSLLRLFKKIYFFFPSSKCFSIYFANFVSNIISKSSTVCRTKSLL